MYKVNDLVFYEHDVKGKGVGKIVVVDGDETYLVHSPNIDGHNARGQDNTNNYWFGHMNLEPFEKRVGQRYKFIGIGNEFDDGDIVTLIDIHEDRASEYGDEDGSDYLYDIDYDFERYGGRPDLEYLDEGAVEDEESIKEEVELVDNPFTQQDLEVGMYYTYYEDNFAIHKIESQFYNIENLRKSVDLCSIFKENENGDLIKVWEREEEQLYTLDGSFTKEETIKIGEHLDWKRVDN